MTFYRTMVAVGAVFAVLGALVLCFQGTVYLIFGLWYGFSVLEILQHLRMQDAIMTNLPGLNDTISLVLGVPLAVVFIVLGGVVGAAGVHALQEEAKWSPPQKK